jgi:acetyltransferase-like isoleucine patch superfamily enzyme
MTVPLTPSSLLNDMRFRRIIGKRQSILASNMPGIHSFPVENEDDVSVSSGIMILLCLHVGAGSVIPSRSTVSDDVAPGFIYQYEIMPIIRPIRNPDVNHSIG